MIKIQLLASLLLTLTHFNLHAFYFDSNRSRVMENNSFTLESNKSDKKKRSYYPNGNIKTEATYKNGKLNGEYQWYYSNGNLEAIETFRKGRNTGLAKYFREEDGSLKSTGKHINGFREGEWKWYYSNGNLEAIETYRKGEVAGLVKHFREEDGSLKSTGKHINGFREGEWKWYYSNGNLEAIKTYHKGEVAGLVKHFREENGTLLSEGNYYNNQKSGQWKWYFQNGNTDLITYYKNGEINGLLEFYREDGTLHSKGNSKGEIRYGRWCLYDENGDLESVRNCNTNSNSEYSFGAENYIDSYITDFVTKNCEYYQSVSMHNSLLEQKELLVLIDSVDHINEKSEFEYAICIIDSFNNIKRSQLAKEIKKQWGTGVSKDDKGILILIASETRGVYITKDDYTISDSKLQKIINADFLPLLKEGDYINGILKCIHKIEEAPRVTFWSDFFWAVILMIIISLVLLGLHYVFRGIDYVYWKVRVFLFGEPKYRSSFFSGSDSYGGSGSGGDSGGGDSGGGGDY